MLAGILLAAHFAGVHESCRRDREARQPRVVQLSVQLCVQLSLHVAVSSTGEVEDALIIELQDDVLAGDPKAMGAVVVVRGPGKRTV